MIDNFLNTLGTKFEFSDLFNSITKEQAIGNDKYFVSDTNNPEIRSKKENIIGKRYFILDFDIREEHKKKYNEVCSDEKLYDYLMEIKEKLGKVDLLKEWMYIVFSGNGFHFYYVGDRKYNQENYENGVLEVYEKIDKILDNEVLKTDKACRTANRLVRMPGSINTKRKKHGLEPKECKIIEDTQKETALLSLLPKFANTRKEKEAKKFVGYEAKQDRKFFTNAESVFDAICQIDIKDLVCRELGLQMQKDQKNFKSPKDGKNIGMFVGDNILINYGTHHMSGGKSGYNTFSFIKEVKCLSNSETYKRFIDNYSEIKDIDLRNKKERHKQQEESKKPEIGDWKKYTMNYGQLLNRTKDFRQSIRKDNLCKYGIEGVDKILQGILPDELVVIGADTGCGKSEIAYNIAISNALNGKKVFLFALEGSLEEIALRHIQREIAKTKEVKTQDYRFNGDLFQEEENDIIEKMNNKIKENLIIFNKTAKTNLAFIKEMILQSKDEIDLFVLDHLHYIHLDSENENREIGEIMRELKIITDTQKKPVVLISHLRKRSGAKELPNVFDLYGSSNIGKEGTTVLLISKPLENIITNEAQLKEERKQETAFICEKSRSGLGKIVFHLMYDLNKKKYEKETIEIDEKYSQTTNKEMGICLGGRTPTKKEKETVSSSGGCVFGFPD